MNTRDALMAVGLKEIEYTSLIVRRTPNRRYRVQFRSGAPATKFAAGNLGLERARQVVTCFLQQDPALLSLAGSRSSCGHGDICLYPTGFRLRPERVQEFRKYRDRHGAMELSSATSSWPAWWNRRNRRTRSGSTTKESTC